MKIPIGIDLGTTYSAIAMVDEHGKPTLILNAGGERITPSAILFEGGGVIVGSDAKRAAISDADRVVLFVKRQMGKADWFFEVDGRRWTAPELSAEILKKLKRDAEERLGASIQEAVITVPAYFADRERTATLQAAELAGLSVLRLINEPTAAALAFELYHPLPSPPAPLPKLGERGEGVRGSKALVFDLGGGTFDVTLLEVEGETMRVLATDGDVYLGGKDWDDQVVNFVATAFESRFGFDPRSEADSYQDLRERCERAKEQLSQLAKTTINCNYGGHSLRVELPREQFEPLTAALLAQTESTVNLVLQTAGVTWADVGTVLLSGGSTRMPQVRAMLKRISGKEPNASVDPDECVAKGAAIQAALLLREREKTDELTPPRSPRGQGEDRTSPRPRGDRGGVPPADERSKGVVGGLSLIVDVTAHSLGTLAMREGRLVNSIVIPKNTPIPAQRNRADYVTTEHNQTSIAVPVLQGEDEDPELCDLVAAYELTGIPPRRAGESEIEVHFTYNPNGVIDVWAKDIRSGKELAKVRRESRLTEFLSQPTATPALDLLFMFDTTGSMYSHLDEVRTHLAEIVREIHTETPEARVAIMAYGDHCDEGTTYLVKGCEFSTDTEQLVNFIHTVEKTGGGDAPEAIEDALWEANRLGWAEMSGKALVLVGDAPSHSVSECPYHRDYRAEAKRLFGRSVRIYTVLCGSDESARRTFARLAGESGGKLLPLANIRDLCDLLVAIAMKEGGKLDAYRARLLAEKRLTDSKRALLQILE